MKATQAVVSKKNPFWIPKNRYYELKYFCLQFWDWQKRRAQLDGLATRENREPTEWEAIERVDLTNKICMIMDSARLAAHDYDEYILTGVTKGSSYDTMSKSPNKGSSFLFAQNQHEATRKLCYISKEEI